MDPYAYSSSPMGNGNYRSPVGTQSQNYSYGWGSSSISAAAVSQNFRNTPSYGNAPKMPKPQLAQNRSGVGYGQWIAPGAARALGMEGGGFPQKNWGSFGQQMPKKKKETDPTGKTPAMLIHELYKDITENYEEVTSQPKAYRCILTVAGQQFAMVAPAKKTAKQKTAEMALRTLRPDLNVTPFEDGVVVQPVKDGAVVTAASRPANTSENEGAPPAKKPKLNALESALSLLDCLRKLCAERVSEGPFNPVFDLTDITGSAATAGEKRKFRAVLTFAEQGKIYTHEGFGKIATRDVVVREALLDLFQVPQAEIRRIVRRHLMGKLTDMPIVQTLYQVAHLCGCEVEFKVDIATDKAIGQAPSTYVAVCTLIDHSMDGKKVEFTSPPSRSKHEAKEYAAHELLRSHFDIDPPTAVPEAVPAGEQPVPPCQKLHVLLAKQNRSVTPNIKYEDLGASDDSVSQMGTIFRSKLTINDKEEFIGSGKSKKAAKNDAAMMALKKIFMYDYNDPNSCPVVVEAPKKRRAGGSGCSQLCFDVSEYAKREYYSMCNFYAVKPSTEVAAFFLVNELDEKRLVAIGSSRPGVVHGQTIGTSRGTAVIHFDPIVLARRSLIRYLINEVGKLGDPKCIFVRSEDGMLMLNEGLRLVLYATYAPNCCYSCTEASVKKLSYLGPKNLIPVPDETQPLADIQQTGRINVHCSADKIFKWSKIGVQGALLSTLMHPILPHSVFFGSQAPVSDASLLHALFGRLEPPSIPCKVESIRNKINLLTAASHVWTRDMEHVEMLNVESGRTNKGSPSRLCKAAIFEAFLKYAPASMKCGTYMEAKEKAVSYNEAKRALYEQMHAAGLGKWQTKPVKLVDFSLDSYDA